MLSKDFAALDRKFMEIDGKMKKFDSIHKDFYTPIRFGNEILKDIKNTIFLSEKVNAKSEYDRLLLMNFQERLNSLRTYIENRILGKLEYNSELEYLNIKKSDIDKIIFFAESLDVQKIAGFYAKQEKNLFWKNAITEAEVEKIKKIINSFLKLSLENSHLRGKFKSVEDYRKTIEVSQHSEKSYHHYGKVYFSIQSFQFAGFYKGNEFFEYPDVFVAAKVIGEEGLFGHQGQYLTTANSNLPNFMKIPSWSSSSVNEYIGTLGKGLFTELVINNNSVKKEFSGIIAIQKEENKFADTKAFIRLFAEAISEYMKEAEKSSNKLIGNYLSRLTGLGFYRSEFFRKWFEGRYSYDFLADFRNNVQKWSYLYADYLSEKIQKRIDKFNGEEKRMFLKNIMTGYWAKNTFEKYVDWLLKS